MEPVSQLLRQSLIMLIKLYRYGVSPWLQSRCRYTPTCACYAEIAIKRYGNWIGVWMSVKRLLRCHPWGGYGYDPVPNKVTR